MFEHHAKKNNRSANLTVKDNHVADDSDNELRSAQSDSKIDTAHLRQMLDHSGSQPLAYAVIQRLQSTLGNAKVSQLLQNSPKITPLNRSVLQRVQIKVENNKIVSVSVKNDKRKGGSIRGHQGDHTAAYTVFKSMVRNWVMGKSLQQAAADLANLAAAIKTLPGMQIKSSDWIHQGLEQTIHALQGMSKAANIDPESLEQEMDNIIRYRNSIPLSAFRYRKSSGGHDEAGKKGHLQVWCEDKLRNDPKAVLPNGIISGALVSMWGLLDYDPPPSVKEVEMANVILQHIYSMQQAFPRTFEYLSRTNNYLIPFAMNNKLIQAKLKRIHPNVIANVMKNVEAAVIKGIAAYDMGASKNFDKSETKGY